MLVNCIHIRKYDNLQKEYGHLINHDGFPWALSENLRHNILKPGILKEYELEEYVNNSRIDTLKNVVHLD